MKKIYLYTAMGAALLMGNASCSDDFLQIDHYDIIQPEVLLTSQEYVEQGLNGIYDLFYGEQSSGDDIQKNWNLKPHMAFANYPTLDMQPNGWDVEFTRQEWRPDKDMFIVSWRRAYNVIDRANRFLANLANADPNVFQGGEATMKKIEAEARAARAYYYTFLAQNYGGVPILQTGETYTNTPNKPRGTAEEAWNMVIEDLEFTRDALDWEPRNNEKGRITKGMAKAYLAQAYMYNKRFADAKKELKDIIDSGPYSLNPCYGQIHLGIQQGGQYWQDESIWEISYPQHSTMGWGTEGKTDGVWWPSQLLASGEWGGWGPHFTSFEFCWSFESGDKRLQYEVVQYGDSHPYTEEQIGGSSEAWAHPFVGTEVNPNNYNIKLWKEHPSVPYAAIPSIQMRLAAVILNYAECCFETEGDNSAAGWAAIQQIRDRAWGALEPKAPTIANFPFKLNTASVKAPDAQTYYSTYKRTPGKISGTTNRFLGFKENPDGSTYQEQTKYGQNTYVGRYEKTLFTSSYNYTPYTVNPWKVALMMERRHEFYAEYSFWYDLCRTEMVKEYLDAEYPKNNDIFDDTHIHTARTFDYNPARLLYPIPSEEILKNGALTQADQNPGY